MDIKTTLKPNAISDTMIVHFILRTPLILIVAGFPEQKTGRVEEGAATGACDWLVTVEFGVQGVSQVTKSGEIPIET